MSTSWPNRKGKHMPVSAMFSPRRPALTTLTPAPVASTNIAVKIWLETRMPSSAPGTRLAFQLLLNARL